MPIFNQFPARNAPISDGTGYVTDAWARFFENVWRKFGAGASGLTILDLVKRAGDTMTGRFFLAVDPTAPKEAATKAYVDAGAGVPSNATPQPVVGPATPGVSPLLSRGDHVHGTTGQKGAISRVWENNAIVMDGVHYGGPPTRLPYTINTLEARTLAGSTSVAVRINGAAVPGLNMIPVTTTLATTTPAPFAVALGDRIDFVLSGTAPGTLDALLTVNTTRL